MCSNSAKTRKLTAIEIEFLRRYIAERFPDAMDLYNSQVARGPATVTEKPGFVTMIIGNIDVEITAGGDYNGMNIKMWYCGNPMSDII